MIYLDSAATSLQKPSCVGDAVLDAMLKAASPGRGTHLPAMRAADTCYECREHLARLFNVEDPEKIVFTLNATHALNIAISSLCGKDTRVLVSGFEHNSVMRPLYAKGVRPIVIDTPLFDAGAFLQRLGEEIDNCDVVVTTYVSNAFGYVLPVYDIARLCKKKDKRLIIDASQAAGAFEINAQKLCADFIAMPGHKALLGPQGTGVLVCKGDASPILYGGSGSQSAIESMPEFLPDRLEAGTSNVSGIAGLNAGVKYLLDYGTENIRTHERMLLDTFYEVIESAREVRAFYDEGRGTQSGILSLVPEGLTCERLAEKLGKRGIAIRSGLLCAPLAHQTAGTFQTGTARFSFSPFVTQEEARFAGLEVLKTLRE